MRFLSAVPMLLLCATPLLSQSNDPGKFGINLTIDDIPSVGFSWRVSPTVTLRPSFSFTWQKSENTFLGTNEVTQYFVNLDLLFQAASWDRVATYVGFGGGVGNVSGGGLSEGKTWAARALLGARVKVVERVWVFGEMGFAYSNAEGLFGKDARLQTFPIGVTVFLK
jgi:hypothetical protein